MNRWTTKEEEFTLQKYGYQSKKRKVTVYLAWSNHGSPILFYHGLDIELSRQNKCSSVSFENLTKNNQIYWRVDIMQMKILVCGSRDWHEFGFILLQLKRLPKDTIIINGACKGADKLSTKAAQTLGLQVKEYPAEWDKYGKSAGPKRNSQMLLENPDEVWAFHYDLYNSKGTLDMVKKAQAKNIKVVLYNTRGERFEL